jgi:hypothetical protein
MVASEEGLSCVETAIGTDSIKMDGRAPFIRIMDLVAEQEDDKGVKVISHASADNYCLS